MPRTAAAADAGQAGIGSRLKLLDFPSEENLAASGDEHVNAAGAPEPGLYRSRRSYDHWWVAQMGAVEYSSDVSSLHPDQLEGFFVGWPHPPSPEKHLALLQGSDRVVLGTFTSGRVVGFVTAITDGELSAYIPFLEVLPSFQRQGIGTELVRRLLDSLSGLYMIDVCCDAELEPFYRRFDMKVLERGMGLRNRAAFLGKPS